MRFIRRSVSLVLLVLLMVTGSAVSGHANLARSEPEANAILDEAPHQVRLWFTETPEPRFSVIELINAQGTTISGVGSIQVDPKDSNLLSVSLPTLPQGVYTVNWKALSAADGHTTVGAFAFAVGRDQAGAIKPFIKGELGSTSTPSLPSVAVRWLSYLAMAVLTGGFNFVPLVYRPALTPNIGKRNTRSKNSAAANGVSFSHASGLFSALLSGYGLLVLSTLAGALVQAASAQIDLIGLLTATRFAGIFWLRVILIIGLGGLLAFRQSRYWRSNYALSWWWAGVVLNVAILLTTSLGSHAAAISDPLLPVIADWLHLNMVGIWFGGLIGLLLTLRWLHRTEGAKAARPMAILVSRFSQVAAVCVALIGVSGAFRSIYEVGDAANLIDTQYGVVLLSKLVLLIPILGSAALNLTVIQRRMHEAARIDANGTTVQPWYRLIRRTVTTEIIFISGVLFVTGLLTSLAPAREAFGAGLVVRGQIDDLRVLVAVNPGTPGLNQFDIYLKDALNRSIPDLQKVALYFSMSGHEMGIQEAVAERIEAGHYAVSGGYTSMIGLWEAEVLVRRTGLDDARLKLKVPLLSLTRTSDTLTLITPSSLLVGIELLVAALILLLGAPRLGRARPKADLVAQMGAGVALVLSLFAFSNAFNAGENGILALQNPIPADAASLARGQKLYQDNCMACHGEAGAGDGPVGITLKPPPANLQIHMNDGHSDGLLFNWLTNGIQGSAMPAFGGRLTDQERWDTLNYIRTFEKPK